MQQYIKYKIERIRIYKLKHTRSLIYIGILEGYLPSLLQNYW